MFLHTFSTENALFSEKRCFDQSEKENGSGHLVRKKKQKFGIAEISCR